MLAIVVVCIAILFFIFITDISQNLLCCETVYFFFLGFHFFYLFSPNSGLVVMNISYLISELSCFACHSRGDDSVGGGHPGRQLPSYAASLFRESWQSRCTQWGCLLHAYTFCSPSCFQIFWIFFCRGI